MKIYVVLILVFNWCLTQAQINCFDPIGNVVLTHAQNFPIDVDGDGDDDYRFDFSGGGGGYQFDLRPIGGEEIQTCGDLGTLFACAYDPGADVSSGPPYANDPHALAAFDFMMGELGNFFPGAFQYIVFRIGLQRGWIEIFINTISETQVDFNIGQYGIEPPAGVNPLEVGNCSAVLPITMGEYGLNQLADGIEVYWEVLDQFDVEYFELQRSINGVDFLNLAKIFPRAVVPTFYHKKDNTPMPGRNYYRIAAVDLDGTVNYSGIKEATWNSDEWKIFPNPILGHESVQVLGVEKGHLYIYNNAGILIQELSIEAPTQVPVMEWPEGSCTVCVLEAGEPLTCAKVFKIR